ncbi:MAG: BMP family ABC transporter substrate-binding protein [Actinobacteria bacterium]|nr:MAG: BMP family ABC transporter substrate-binding protein [Actinomycetota bacterium]
MLRRLLPPLLVVLLVAGCGGSKSSSGTATATAGSAKRIKVGLVTDINQLNDRGFNHLAYLGLLRAEKRLGITGRVYQSASAQDYIPNLAQFAKLHYDLVISVGFAQADAVAKVAKRFPSTHFAIIDVDATTLAGKPKNVLGLLFREQEVGYLAGYLAGLVEKQKPGPDVIGSVGGMKEPPVDRFIAGYQAGARKADPGIKLLNAYSHDWVDLAKCKEAALSQIASGSSIEFQVAGGCGLGTLDAAKEKGVWGIGVDADQSFLGSQILTSATKHVDQAVYLTIQDVLSGKFRGGRNAVFGLKDNGVGLGSISPRVPKADVTKLDKIRAQIANGSLGGIPTTVS